MLRGGCEMLEGWVKIYRCIQDNWIWQEPVKLKWWLDLILLVNHKQRKVLIGDELITVERGAYHTSEVKLAERWGVDRKTVRKFLALLEKDGMIAVEKSRKLGTTIKVCGYESYQQGSDVSKAVANNSDNMVDNVDKSIISGNDKVVDKNIINNMNNDYDKGKDKTRDMGMVIDMSNRRDINNNGKNDNNVKNSKNVSKDIAKDSSGSSVYETFENNGFGLLSPVFIDIINDLVDTYGEQWVKDAVVVAVTSGKRNLKYVHGILKNWSSNGRGEIDRGNKDNGSFKQDIGESKGQWAANGSRGNNDKWSDFKPTEQKFSGEIYCEGIL